MRFVPLVLITLLPLAFAQQQSDVAAQREAMRKLAFLAGKWQGPATVQRGPGETLEITQSEDVQYKLDGLLMTVEGTGRDKDGKAVFRAFATIAYDDAAKTYRFRAYHDGRYLDTDLTVTGGGFSWAFAAGPGRVVNTMKLTSKGEWAETTDFIMGQNPPRRSVEMLLAKKP